MIHCIVWYWLWICLYTKIKYLQNYFFETLHIPLIPCDIYTHNEVQRREERREYKARIADIHECAKPHNDIECTSRCCRCSICIVCYCGATALKGRPFIYTRIVYNFINASADIYSLQLSSGYAGIFSAGIFVKLLFIIIRKSLYIYF